MWVSKILLFRRWRMDWSSIDHDKESVLSDSICNILGLDNSEDYDAKWEVINP